MAKDNRTVIKAEPGKQEIVITRAFDASRDVVFKAFVDPTAVPQWWGPRELKTTVDQMDVRAGGQWHYTQRDSKGNEYAFHGVYHAVQSPGRIVQTFEFEGAPGHVSLETMTLEEQGGKTLLKTVSVFQSLQDRDAMVAAGMEKGVVEGYEQFDELLAKRRNA